MKSDIETARMFISEINNEGLWKYYEIRACLLKYADDDQEWKVGFLFVRLLHNKIPVRTVLPNLKRLKMIHKVFPIKTLEGLLKSISRRQRLRIGGVDASLKLITTPLKYDLYWNSHPYSSLFGVKDPCYGLSASGDYSSNLEDTLETIRVELNSLSTPFRDLRHACRVHFNLDFGTPAFSQFVVVFAPVLASIGNVTFNRKKIEISLRVSSEIDLHKLKINLFGNNDRGEPTSLHQQITEFHRAEDSEIVISPAVTPDEQSTYAKLDLYYNKKLIDTRAVGIVTPVDSEITFQYDIYDIPKLKSEIKSLFEEAEREQNAFSRGIKFEQVIMKVVSLVPDLKVSDHNVNDKIEELDIQVRNHNRKYIWADFDDVFFIECKYRSERVEAKDIRDFIGKMEKNRRKVGILVSVSGVTGTEEMEGARGEIKTTFMQRGTHVIILDKNDLEEIFQCRDISEIVDKRYTDVFKWKFVSEDETNQAAIAVADEISKLVRLKKQGHLTKEEFSLMKRNLINKM